MPYDPARHHRRSIRLKGYDYTQAGAYFITIVTQGRLCLFGEVVAGEMRMNDAGRMVHQVWDELALFYEGVQTDAFIVMPNHVHGIIILTGNVRATPRGCPDDATPHVHPDETPVGAGPRACPDDIGPRACPDEMDVRAGPRACPNSQSTAAPTAPSHPPMGQPRSPSGQAQGPAPTAPTVPTVPTTSPHPPMGQPHSPSGQAQGPAPTAPTVPTTSPHPPMGQPHSPSGQPQGVAPTLGLGLPDVVHRFKTMTTKRYADGVRANQWPPFPGRLWQRNYYEHIIRDVGATGRSPLQRIREYILTNPLRWHLDRERDIGADPSDVIGDGA